MAHGDADVRAIYHIPTEALARVKEKIAALNKRATRLGLDQEARVEVVRHLPYMVHDAQGEPLFTVPGVEIYIEGGIVVLPGGWRVLAVKKHEAGLDRPLVTRIDSEEAIPQKYYTLGPECDHCKINRPRNTTFVLRNEAGETVQVGKTCLKDFLGHYPESAISFAAALGELDDELRGGAFEKDPTAGGIDMLYFLALVVFHVDKFGYVKARETDDAGREKESTAQSVIGYIRDLSKPGSHVTPIKLERDEMRRAEVVRDWAREAALTQTSDYWHNLAASLSVDFVTQRTAGFVASTVPVYARHLEKRAEAERKTKSGANEWVGEVGDKLKGLKLTLQRKIVNDGMYGTTYILKFTDDAGHAFTWFSSSGTDKDGEIWGEGGEVYYGNATVKKLDTFRDEKQTVLTRANLSRKESVALEKKATKSRKPSASSIKAKTPKGASIYQCTTSGLFHAEIAMFPEEPDPWDRKYFSIGVFSTLEDAIAAAKERRGAMANENIDTRTKAMVSAKDWAELPNPQFVTPTSVEDAKSRLKRISKNIKKAESEREDASKAGYDWGVRAADENLAELKAAKTHFETWLATQARGAAAARVASVRAVWAAEAAAAAAAERDDDSGEWDSEQDDADLARSRSAEAEVAYMRAAVAAAKEALRK